MEKNKQQQKVESNSEAYQAGRDLNIHQGLQYKEVKEIALDVFKSNFHDLGNTVQEVIEKRAEDFITMYLDKLNKTAPNSLDKTADPDMRYVIYEAQKSHARKGDENIADLMTNLLVDRTLAEDSDFLKLVCNEALEIIPKLTQSQIDMLTVIFLSRYVNLKVFNDLNHVANVISTYSNEINTNEFSFQHLNYLGCIDISIGEVNILDFLQESHPIREPYNLQEYKEDLASFNQKYERLIYLWENTKIKNCSLTSVGISIAISNFNRKNGEVFDINTFLLL